jgi:hypothetical protein
MIYLFFEGKKKKKKKKLKKLKKIDYPLENKIG